MPKLLIHRFAEDSISQFRIAARIRNEDAWRLASAGRCAAAIYLWGYVSEMTLKAAWFALIGFPESRSISPSDLRSARMMAVGTYGIPWAGNLHAVCHWAHLIITHRIALGHSYFDPGFHIQVIEHSQRVYERWRETLRYKKNRAYPFEVRVVSESAEWLLLNSPRL